MRNFHWVGFWAALTLLGCGEAHRAATPPGHVVRTTGSAVALSRDERIAVMSNRSAGVITVFALDPKNGPGQTMITGKVELDAGTGSEPWAAVIGADDDTAYVLFRRSHTVAKISSLHGSPVLEQARVQVGSEPSAIAISGSGKQLFVANWGEGTVSVIRTKTFGTAEAQDPTVDLNRPLARTGALGEIAARPALAHPRALAVTDNGDDQDEDETLYATEFFAQPIPSVKAAADLSDVDRNHQGFVYRINLENAYTSVISIAPIQATGFLDGANRMTSCFPNQLYAAALNKGRLYVTSMCTSPRGPVGPLDASAAALATDKNFKTLFHPAVFVIDTVSSQELPLEGQLLTRRLANYYESGEDDTNARMPLIPNDIAFTSSVNGSTAYVSALGADAVFRLEYDQTGTLQEIGSPGARAIQVNSDGVNTLPVGIALSSASTTPFLLVANDAAQRLWIVDRSSENIAAVQAAPDTPHASDMLASGENKGRKLFATGRDVWSYKGQAWSSCESCHPGGLSDGVTWFFSRGPRRTISTAGTYDKALKASDRKRRILLWGANIDEIHDIEAIIRSVSGGTGAALWNYADPPSNDCRIIYDGSVPNSTGSVSCPTQKATSLLESGLNGSLAGLVRKGEFCGAPGACDSIGSTDWDQVETFIRSLRAPRAPTNTTTSDSTEGRALFVAGKCAGCHGGPGWTTSKLFYEPGVRQNGALPSSKPLTGPLELGDLRTSTYSVPLSLMALNPPALAASLVGEQPTLRTAPATSETDPISFVYGLGNQGNEQIQCALRNVGTFPSQSSTDGIVAAGAPFVMEFRADMKTRAQGGNGFNPPSLFGLAEGAPYFHAGNARTLEEVFDEAFAAHYQALAPDFLPKSASRSDQIARLVTFLLSIDESTPLQNIPLLENVSTGDQASGALSYDFCQNR